MARQVNIDYSNFETLGEIKNKYPDSTFVMRKQFIDMAIQHEWNHVRQIGQQLGTCIELTPRMKSNARALAVITTEKLTEKFVVELQEAIESCADEFGELHVRVQIYKEPRR